MKLAATAAFFLCFISVAPITGLPVYPPPVHGNKVAKEKQMTAKPEDIRKNPHSQIRFSCTIPYPLPTFLLLDTSSRLTSISLAVCDPTLSSALGSDDSPILQSITPS